MENEPQTITANELTTGAIFPPVNENAINAFTENTPETPKPAPAEDMTGYNPEIHETPPRRNKRGEWAKRRGNKKGFVVGKSKTENNENAPEIKIEIPPTPEEMANAEAEATATANALEISTQQASFLISNCFFVGLRVYSDYEPTPADAQAHQTACYDYLMSTGGVDLPNWATLAVLSAQQIMLASQKPKAKTRLQKIKDWFILKFYAWKNRKSNRTKTDTCAPKEAQAE